MSTRQLTVLMSGQTAGRVTRDAGGSGPLVFDQVHSLAMSALADPRILAANNPQAWRATAAEVGLDPSEGVDRVERIASAMREALERAVSELDPEHRAARVVAALSSMVPNRISKCLSALVGSVV